MTFGGDPPAPPVEAAGPGFAATVPPPAASGPPRSAPPPVVGARQLFGASFDLLLRVSGSLRPPSFYVGLVVLGTVGPLVLALLGVASVVDLDTLFAVDAFDPAAPGPELPIASGTTVWLFVLMMLAFAGILVASIESSAAAIALLGAYLVGHPLTTRQAIARSRMAFWLLVVAGLLIGVPTAIVQAVINEVLAQSVEAGSVVGLIAAVVIQAPFVYATSGIVLGGVGPVEAFRRSVRVFRARKAAGLVVTLFPVLFQFVLVAGLFGGLGVIARLVTTLGLDVHSGAGALALLSILAVMATFSVGTLLFTAAALSAAPQVVMFVSLTHATIGLDAVRRGGANDPDDYGAGRQRFRWLTRPMLGGFLLGGVALAAFVALFGP